MANFLKISAALKKRAAQIQLLLMEGVVSYSDGGGFVRAAGVQFLAASVWQRLLPQSLHWCWKGVTLDWVDTNGQAAVLILRDGVPIGLTIDASAQGIK